MFFEQVILKFCNIYKKAPVFEILFNKIVLNLFINNRLQHMYFPVNILKQLLLQNTSGCFLPDLIIYFD